MIFKYRYEILGTHAHLDLFCARQTNLTWAKCGSICINAADLDDFSLASPGIDFEEKEK